MAIGSVTASGGLQTQLVQDNSSQIRAQAMSGLGEAVDRLAQAGMGYLNSRTDIEAVYDRRAQESKALEIDTQLLQYQQDRAREFTEFSRARSANPAGLTRDYDLELAKKEEAFLASVPPRFKEEVKAKLAQDRATRVGAAFSSELTLLDTVDTNNLNTSLNTLGSALKGGTISLADAEETWAETLGKTSLPEEDKNTFLERGRATLQGLEFGTQIDNAARGYGTVREGTDGTDVVAAGLMPGERAVLNGIASREGPGYNIWNGGSSFEGYADHPAASGKAPGKSTAAGRYQFTLGTWRSASADYERKTGVKVPDFSPEWQDRVALSHAEDIFNQWNKEGLNFREVIASGDPAQLVKVRRVLGNPKTSDPNSVTWEGWADRTFGPGGAEAADRAWIQQLTGDSGYAGGGTGAPNTPNVWTDPRFSNLSLETKLSFADAASASVEKYRKDQAAQITFERNQYLDEVYNAGYKNDPGMLEALKQTKGWDAEAQAKYNSGRDIYRASQDAGDKVAKVLASGTPLASSDAKALGTWFGQDGFSGIISGDQAAYTKLRWAVNQSRLLPEGSADAFALAMDNPTTAPGALEFLASAIAGDSTLLKRSGFSDDMIANVRLFKSLAENEGSQQAAMQKYGMATDMAAKTGKTPSKLESEANESFLSTYQTASELVDKWDGWFSWAPDSKMNEATESQLFGDAAAAYQRGYSIYGTAEGADAYMQTTLDNLWGVSQTQKPVNVTGPLGVKVSETTTSGVLMRLPPEKYYPAKDNDYGYLYNGIADFAESAGAKRTDAVLIPDDITEKEVRNGKAPTYKVLGMGEYGEAILLDGRFGGESLNAQAKATIEDAALTENSLSYVDKYGEELSTLKLELSQRSFGSADLPIEPEEQARIDDLTQKRDAAVIAAFEQGRISPEVATSNVSVDETAARMAAVIREKLTSDDAFARRVKQATGGNRGDSPDAVLSRLVAKELKVPASLADIIVTKMNEAN